MTLKPLLIGLVCIFGACGPAVSVSSGTNACNGVAPLYVTLQHNGSGAAPSMTMDRAGVARFPRSIYGLTGNSTTSMRAYITIAGSLCEYRPPANGQAFLAYTCVAGTEVEVTVNDTISMYRDGGGVLVETEVTVQ